MPTLEDARSLEPITAANLADDDLDFVMEASSDRIRPVKFSERRKTVAQVVGEPPVNEATATLTVDPDGDNNSLLYTSVLRGASGNAISVDYNTPVSAETTVAVSGTDIVVNAGTKAVMTVSGTLVPDATGVFISAGSYFGGLVPVWTTSGSQTIPQSGPFAILFIDTTTGLVNLTHYTNNVADGSWTDPGPYNWPDEAVALSPDDAETGTPTITASISTAQMVLDALEASAAVTAIVTPTAVDTITGSVAATAKANLTGGVTATAATAPFLTDGDYGYINTGTTAYPVWKEFPLYALGATP